MTGLVMVRGLVIPLGSTVLVEGTMDSYYNVETEQTTVIGEFISLECIIYSVNADGIVEFMDEENEDGAIFYKINSAYIDNIEVY